MTGRPADHPRPDHTCTRHTAGARACYVRHGCRCRDCTDTATAVARKYKWVHGNGRSAKVPGGPVRAHLARLRAAGMSTAEIERVTGVPQATFRNIESGRVTDVQRPTAQAILAAKPVPVAQQRVGFVDGTGTRRRLQALAAIGWTGPALAAKLGRSRTRVRAILRGDGEVSAALRARVMALYDDLWDQPQTGTQSLRAALAAQRHGWAPPLAWDDGHGPHGIDNPAAKPATAPDPTGRGHRAAELAMLLDAGESPEHAAQQCGWQSRESALKWLNRHGHADLAQRIRTDPETLRRCA